MEKASDYDVIVEAACKLMGAVATPDPAPHMQAVRSCEIITPEMTVSVTEYPDYTNTFIDHATSAMHQPEGECASDALHRIDMELPIARRDFPEYVDSLNKAQGVFAEKTKAQNLCYVSKAEQHLPGYDVYLAVPKDSKVNLFHLGAETTGEVHVNHDDMRSFYHKRNLKSGLYVFKCRELDNVLHIDWRSDDCGYQMRNLSTILQTEKNVKVKLRRFLVKPELVESDDELPDTPEYNEIMITYEHVFLEFWVK